MNLQFAKNAVANAKKRLPRGAGNKAGSSAQSAQCVQVMRDSSYDVASLQDYISHLSSFATRAGCGNCAEHAAVAFEFLRAQHVRPLDYMNLNNGDGQSIHVFVVIDYVGESENSSTWGEHAVICDPWDGAGKAYPAWEIGQKMSLWGQATTVSSEVRLG